MQSIWLKADLTFDNWFPNKWGAAVRIQLTEGTQLEGPCRYPRGYHGNPLPALERGKRDAELLALSLPDAERTLAALEAIATTPIRPPVEVFCRC